MVGYLLLPDGREVAVRDGLVLGRVAGCDVVVNDTKASRKHAALRVQGTVVEIEDLDSSNGTLLNGKKVQRRMLRDGDRIQIGAWSISYREGAKAAAPAPLVDDELTFDDEPDLTQKAPPPAPPPRPVAPAVVPPPPPPAAAPPPLRASAPPPAPPPPAATESLEFLDEVVQVRTPPPPKPSARAAAAGKPAAPARERGVLQYHKHTDSRGLLGDDMEQMSAGKRFLLVLFALLVTGILGYLAVHLASG